jgi:hypothetical protein
MALQRLMLAAPLASSGWLGACGGTPPEVEVDFLEWMPNTYRAIPRGTYALRTAGEWNALWLAAPAQFQGDPFPMADKSTPSVDFSRFMLLVLSLGMGLRCNLPQVTRITDQGGARRVYWKTNEDTGTTSSACNYTYPLVTLILAPVGDGVVEFIR